MDCDPCTSDASRHPSKRKKLDDAEYDSVVRPLRANPIDNEYEDLSTGEASDEDEPGRPLPRGEMEQIERAQEASTVTDIGGIKITPFNLEEELEEGEFDKAGNFIFKRRRNSGTDEEENDTWAETVDWDEVKRRELAAQVAGSSKLPNTKESPTQTLNERPKDKVSCYKEMLKIMEPDEIVKKTIRRLGDSIPKRKPSNKNKRSQERGGEIDKTSIDEMRIKLDLMIELAHQRLEEGDVDIYQKSYEELEGAIKILGDDGLHV